jgi:hypothetical protein
VHPDLNGGAKAVDVFFLCSHLMINASECVGLASVLVFSDILIRGSNKYLGFGKADPLHTEGTRCRRA